MALLQEPGVCMQLSLLAGQPSGKTDYCTSIARNSCSVWPVASDVIARPALTCPAQPPNMAALLCKDAHS